MEPCDAAKPGVKGENTFFVVTHRYKKKVQEKTMKIERPIGESNDFL